MTKPKHVSSTGQDLCSDSKRRRSLSWVRGQLQPRRDRDETISVRDRDETETLVFRISRDENETETITFEIETRPRQYCRDSKRDTSYFHTMLQARRSTAIIAPGSNMTNALHLHKSTSLYGPMRKR